MAHDTKMLNQIHQTAQMGQIGLHAALERTDNTAFHDVLRQQLTQYDQIHACANELLKTHGASAKNISAMKKVCTKFMRKMPCRQSHDVEKLAGMVIQGNTRGMIKSMDAIRKFDVMDPQVANLSYRLLRTEQSNIEQMKRYL